MLPDRSCYKRRVSTYEIHCNAGPEQGADATAATAAGRSRTAAIAAALAAASEELRAAALNALISHAAADSSARAGTPASAPAACALRSAECGAGHQGGVKG